MLKPEDVIERLSFAERRLTEFLALNGGNIAGANGSERQQLLQEFFFHLVGATEVLAHLVNDMRSLGIDSESASIPTVIKRLSITDSVKPVMSALNIRTRGCPLPPDPYNDEGYIFRILNYRHQVTHRRRNPLLLRAGSEPPVSFFLDPRHRELGPSEKSIQDEMKYMIELIRKKCEEVLNLL